MHQIGFVQGDLIPFGVGPNLQDFGLRDVRIPQNGDFMLSITQIEFDNVVESLVESSGAFAGNYGIVSDDGFGRDSLAVTLTLNCPQ